MDRASDRCCHRPRRFGPLDRLPATGRFDDHRSRNRHRVLVRIEARSLEDGGYFEDGVFGYDFSEGYTSLESRRPRYGRRAKSRSNAGAAPIELRRQRRIAREAAEEARMDEILEKLHRAGRSALTDEEHRFLVRVSAGTETGQNPVNEALPLRTSVHTEKLPARCVTFAGGSAAGATIPR